MNQPLRILHPLCWPVLGLAFLLVASSPSAQVPEAPLPGQAPLYQTGKASADGLGKFYYGREIAHYMTHEGADWLERPAREAEEKPDLLVKTLQLRPGAIVADIGCGTGYFSWRMAKAVGDSGTIYGVDIQREMLALLDQNMRKQNAPNVVGVLGTAQAPNLPERVDFVLMVDVYHEMSHPAEMMEAICQQLKPGGRLAIVEYRAEDQTVPIKPLHKMTEAQIRKEMADLPLQYVETVHTLPRQHVVIFRRKVD